MVNNRATSLGEARIRTTTERPGHGPWRTDMSAHDRWTGALLLLATVGLVGCSRGGTPAAAEIGGDPASVSAIDAAGLLHRIQLSADAAARIGLTTDTVRAVPGAGGKGAAGREVSVAAAALLYDQDGATWVYEQTAPLTFQRARVALSRVVGELAVLSAGPSAGSSVVTLGAAELRGSEDGVPGE
jgi:hypothetical protein